jgi:hypothetical protein
MNKFFLTFLAMVAFSTISNAQQISLYDNDGEARAYIDFGEDATIFMWDGTPVAFLEKEGDDICVLGFNGSFLGWYEDGILYDKKGYIVGARKDKINFFTGIEEIKGIQRITPIRPIITQVTSVQPVLLSRWSSTSLTEFLYFGNK